MQLDWALPLARRSAIVVPRRDFVLPGGDDARLALTIYATEGGVLIDLSGTGPSVTLLMWTGTVGRSDYGWQSSGALQIEAILPADASGRAFVNIAAGALSTLPRRLAYAIRYSDGDAATTLVQGILQVLPGRASLRLFDGLLDDSGVPITDDLLSAVLE